MQYGGSQLPEECTVLPGLRPLGEDDLVGVGGLRLRGRIDDGVREDTVREVLERLRVFLRVPVRILVTL